MIPRDLDAFRRLMMQARDIAADRRDFNSDAVAIALYDLATATPEQLLGIVGKVDAELYCDLNRVVYHITQRERAT